MKQKKIFLSAVCLLSIFSVKGQRFYAGLSGGYGLGVLNTTYEETTAGYGIAGYAGTTTSKSYSLGQGTSTGLFAGYMFKERLGAELDASYLFGNKFSFHDSYTSPSDYHKYDYTLQSNMIRITPCFRVQFGTGKLSGYSKTGFIIGLSPKIKGTEEDVDAYPGTKYTTYTEWEYTGGLSLGFHQAIGARYNFGKLGIFCEVAANLQNWAMKKGKMTVYKENGADMLSSLPVSEKEVEFKDKYTYGPGSSDPNKPDQVSKMYLPFSSLGLNIGVQMSF